jgi:hypothetical protein
MDYIYADDKSSTTRKLFFYINKISFLKAVVRGFDTVTTFVQERFGVNINKFLIIGQSKVFFFFPNKK